MKKSELFFAIVQIPIDYILVISAGLFAYLFRFYGAESVGASKPVIFEFKSYFVLLFFVAIFWIFCFAISKSYSLRKSKRVLDEFYNVLIGSSLAIVLLILVIFLRQEELFSSRFMVLAVWIFSMLLVWLGRVLTGLFQVSLYKKGIGVKRVIIIGKDRTSGIIVSDMTSGKTGYEILEVLPSPNGEMTVENILDKVREWHKNRKVDQILVADPNVPKLDMVNIIDFADEQKITFKYAADLFETQATNIEVKPVAGIPIVELKMTPLDGWGRILKRTLDIVGSILGIIVFSPLMIFSAIVIKLTSRGPVFADLPPRAGLHGKPFNCLKFRSMYVGAHKDQKKIKSERSGLFKVSNDPRVTRYGEFIRKTSIDETPQFFNVLRGEMSLVGPRPHFLNEYSKKDKKLWTIKPGLTGFAQISGRSDLDFAEEVRLETYYIENWSLRKDIRILIKTPFVLLKRRKAS